MPIKKIQDPIYRVDIYLIFDVAKETAFKFIKSKWNINNLDELWGKAGFCFGMEQDYFIALPDNKKNYHFTTILAHACLHVTSRVLRDVGIFLSDDSEEYYIYYLSWLMHEFTVIYEAHYKSKRRNNNKKS
jgi:hypothetical protein